MSGETIQIVEDEGLIAIHLSEMLEKAGYRVSTPAYSGEVALREIEKSKPDIILMDIGLGGKLDGIDTAREIRERFSIPLIFVTAYTSETALERIRKVAPEGVITKPFLEKNLLALIRKSLNDRVV